MRSESDSSKTVRCPACTADSIYVHQLDRYVHLDGSANRPCWLAITRGETDEAQRLHEAARQAAGQKAFCDGCNGTASTYEDIKHDPWCTAR
ncbi:hypothetical protein [Streptomyces mangrovi]|uniref:hypothetical protein n=1 Tax=Streptomyces mangrovi TaxID=1206892 RepID=UPI00399D1E74